MVIEEVIVVEGKNDTHALKRAFQCDTIETNGSAIADQVINKIKLAKERRGIIIFTDPDFPGEKIRKTIDRAVPGCKHAFLPKEYAIDDRKKKVGVEHASKENIMEAIQQAKPTVIDHNDLDIIISKEELLLAGLLAGEGSRKKRELLGKKLNIGYTNGKQLLNRLLQFQITKEEFLDALRLIEEENEK
ncbi:ribonuclease M5 [Evansella sp. AB-P1]|uniref:ribonuclease M5 n=1 Tax=Evansella sp. AB-P1 TaxID=3037653 RepID=UPI00241E32B7|nr:ribonuclease M5 [Evansella sp. AB-P1]MDG5789972.1 ribonuclease M5 [Evansella sp. AB-P1]